MRIQRLEGSVDLDEVVHMSHPAGFMLFANSVIFVSGA